MKQWEIDREEAKRRGPMPEEIRHKISETLSIRFTSDEIHFMHRLKRAGYSPSEIGEQFGVSGAVIRRAIKKQDWWFVEEEKPEYY